MAVAVAQDEVAARYHAVPDDLVCSRGSTDNEERLIGTKYARRIALSFSDRPSMIEQRANLADRNRNIGAQRVLAKELVKKVAHGAFAKGNTTTMAWGVPGIARMQGIIHQRLEHRRRQALEVVVGSASNDAGDEFRRILE